MAAIQIKRVYDPPAPTDGTRVLVDRLWPRGIKRSSAAIGLWAKALAPSPELRRWFNHDPKRFDEFSRRYRQELRNNQPAVDNFLSQIDRRKRLTLLYAAKDPAINHAVVLKEYLEKQ